MYVGHHGEVQNYKPLQVVTACSLDIYNFPFDVQNCSLTFTSWLHTSEYCTWAPGRGCSLGVEHPWEEDHPPPQEAFSFIQVVYFLNVTEPVPHPPNRTLWSPLLPPSAVARVQ